MSVQYVICDGCGKTHNECEYLIEFAKGGVSVHLCNECIEIAKEMIDQQKKERE